MDTLSRVLQRILGQNPALKLGLIEAKILNLWPAAVGASISKHAQAKTLRGNTLIIEVGHPVWKKELHANQRLALKKLNELITQDPELIDPNTRAPYEIKELFLVGTEPGRDQQKHKYRKSD